MRIRAIDHWQHEHTFGQDQLRSGERRTLIVAVVTAAMMVVEVAAGFAFGSMALLADGLHMGSHAVALAIAVAAYVIGRKQAYNRQWTFGTGKINALGGFSGAVLLAMFAVVMAWQSVEHLIYPEIIAVNEAIVVAFAGLVVNGASAVLLGAGCHGARDGTQHGAAHGDHNLRAAYLHVLADALTSLLAIAALLGAKFFGLVWLDPVVGVLGAILVARWSWSLLIDTSHVLLDRQAPSATCDAIRRVLEADGDERVVDLHVWSIGPGMLAAEIALVGHDPKPPNFYKGLLPDDLGIVHATVEIHRCQD